MCLNLADLLRVAGWVRNKQQQALMAINGAGYGMNSAESSEVVRALADKLQGSPAAFLEVLASLLERGTSAGWSGRVRRLEFARALFCGGQPARIVCWL